jgi:putative ABC transport system permease protein
MNDLKHSVRMLLRSPGFTIAAVAALTLGIGAATAIFSVINTVLLKPLSYPDTARIVQFYISTPNGPDAGGSPARFNALSFETRAFEDLTAYEYDGIGLNLTGGPYPEQVRAIHVSAGYFHLFGAPFILGRAFTAEEDRPNAGRLAVLSYGLWQRRFASDPAIVGKTISLSTEPYTVAGVIGPGFSTELDMPPDVWIPFQIDPASTDNARYFGMAGRLRPGVTKQMANVELALAMQEFRRRAPNQAGPRDEFRIQPFQDALVLDVRPSLLVLAGAVSLLLLIASANVANLLLVRATSRKREIAIRTAVGAGRGRIVRQLLTESLVLSLAGGALGLALGMAGIRALLAIHPGNIPRIGPHGALVSMDWRVVGFTMAVALVIGAVFGLYPALEASHADLNTSLKEASGRSGTGAHSHKTRSVLVTAEIAIALILLIGSALLARSFAAMRAIDPGLNPHDVLTMRMSLTGPRFEHSRQVGDVVRAGVQRVEALPGVAHASASYAVPTETMFGVPFNIVGRTPRNGLYDGRGWVAASPGYFDALRIPVLRGRAFGDRDDFAGARVAIINEALATEFWPHGEPLGERLILGKGYGPEFEEPAREIVGIVGNVRNFGITVAPRPAVYIPLAQVTDGISALAERASSLVWIIRTQGAPNPLSAAIQTELQQASGGLPVASVRTMDQVLSQSSASADFNSVVMSIFGVAAVLLAAIGIYGLMAYSVAQRTQEIGIRLALGAEPRGIRNMVVREGVRLAAVGLALGLAAAFGLTRLLASLLYGVQPRDPMVFAAAPAILAGIALFSVWLPARRATRIDPLQALRAE